LLPFRKTKTGGLSQKWNSRSNRIHSYPANLLGKASTNKWKHWGRHATKHVPGM